MKMNKRVVSIALVAAMTFTALPVNVRAEAADNKPASDLSYSGYDLKWEDDFTGNSLNREDWNVELHDPGWVNSELQAYVDSEDNISVKDGNLYINPVKKTNEDGSVSYTSGRINTQNKKDFTYGLFEVRAKVPKGMGYLPAFWLMATDENVYGQWPRCGEIDCMEVMGQDPQKAYGTIHYGNPHQEDQGTFNLTGDDNFSDQFHTFSCEWEPGSIKWYIDGQLYHTANNWYSTTVGQGTLSYPAPFDQPFYIILNLAVGGSWVGNPDESTSFENNPYVIDYVKVFQKDSYNEDVTRPEVKVDLRDPDANGNYINNGDFSVAEDLTDDNDWKFLTALGGEATANIADNTMNILTTKDGTVDYSVQLVQPGLPLEKGATYQVQFDASASEARTMFTAVKAPDHGYSEYMPSTKVELTTEKKTYTYTFKMTADSDANGRLEYNMGKSGSTADIHISNVSVKKIKDADPNEKEVKTVLSNGNYVYNGSFQEGDHHLGYWDVTKSDDAKVSVTNFADSRRLKVESPEGAALDSVKISQEDLAFTPGKPYAFSFTADGQEGKEIKAIVGGHEYTAKLNGTNKKFTFRIPGDAEFANQNIVFELGGVGTVLLDNVKLAEDALIANGSFNDDFTGYEWYCDSSADASYVVDSQHEDNALDITVNDTSDQDWKIQVKQNNVNLEKGKWYTLSFSAKSSLDRDIRVIMQGGENKGWAVYSGENTVSVSSDFQRYSKTFQMTEETDPAAFLSICLGKIGDRITKQHRVVIDNISLVETSDPSANILKNADFSDGMNGWTETIANWGPEYVTDASSSIADGAITYSIKNPGEDNWHVQLKQTELPVVEGNTYKVSFDAQSTVTRNILAGVQSGKSYAQYHQDNVELSANESKHVEFTFTMDNSEEPIEFYVSMGKVGDTPASDITLSNFSIVNTDGSKPDDGKDDKDDDKKDDQDDKDEEVDPNGNLLSNSDFSIDFKGWTETIANWGGTATAEATRSIDGNKIIYDIVNPGNETWHVQLKHTNVPLLADKTYRVSFDAETTAERSIMAGLQSTEYAWYGDTTAALKAGETNHVSFDVTMKTDDKAADFYVSMGKVDDNTPASVITLSNFSIVEVKENPDPTPDSPEIGQTECKHEFENVTVPATTAKDGYTAKVCAKCKEMTDKVDINRIAKISLDSKKVYTGKSLKAKVLVKDSKNNTIDAKNYTLKYSSNKNVGYAKVTITFKGNYQGKVTKTFKIVPATPGKVKALALKKGFKVSWKKQTAQVDGLQIQYATNKSFKKAATKTVSKKTVSKTIKGLKSKKTVYVRVRAYKTVKVNGKSTRIYSSWSKVIKVKTK